MKSIQWFSLFSFSFSFSVAMPSFQTVKKHLERYEGNSSLVYVCPKGYKTVGIGINLDAKFPNNKYKVGDSVNSNSIRTWEFEEIERAKQIAKRVFPSFDEQPEKVQILLISLSYNLGEGGIKKFVKFKKAIESFKYDLAAKELRDSLWYRQTGRRGKDYVAMLVSQNSLKNS